MNTRYFYDYIARQLHTNLRIYSPQLKLTEKYDHSLQQTDLLDQLPELESELLSGASAACPVAFEINNKTVYTVVRTVDSIILLGPVSLYSKLTFNRIAQSPSQEAFSNISIFTSELYTYIQHVILVHNLYSANIVTEEDFFLFNFTDNSGANVQKAYNELIFQNREESRHHNPYSQERRMLSSIQNGDLAMLEKCRSEEHIGDFGTLAREPDRNYRNLAICVITLVSRAAIDGGMNPELAFSLCDAYIMQIEDLKNLGNMALIVEQAKTNFATLVHEQKSRQQSDRKRSPHPIVEKSKDYIFSHLHGKITLQEVAEKLNVNPNYLTELFKKHEGVPFSTFVTAEKINLVKNLLIYSSYSYIDIAAYLGFSSQSHLGKQFKLFTGMTLREYRNRYTSTEFQEQ